MRRSGTEGCLAWVEMEMGEMKMKRERGYS